jgi:ribosome-associated protein
MRIAATGAVAGAPATVSINGSAVPIPSRPVDCTFDTPAVPDEARPMSDSGTTAPQTVTVRSVPIELNQLLKFCGAADSGGAAKQAIADSRVTVNGAVETRRGRKLVAGDRVTCDGRTFIVGLG